jgi:hypothetical protein
LIIMCYVVHKTNLKLECTILTTLLFASAENTDIWHARKGDLQRAFPLDVPMVCLLKLTFVANGNNLTGVDIAPSETIYFGSLEFTADRFGRLSLSPKGVDLGAIFVGMVHNRLPSLRTTLEESSNGGKAASGEGGTMDPSDPEGAMW